MTRLKFILAAAVLFCAFYSGAFAQSEGQIKEMIADLETTLLLMDDWECKAIFNSADSAELKNALNWKGLERLADDGDPAFVLIRNESDIEYEDNSEYTLEGNLIVNLRFITKWQDDRWLYGYDFYYEFEEKGAWQRQEDLLYHIPEETAAPRYAKSAMIAPKKDITELSEKILEKFKNFFSSKSNVEDWQKNVAAKLEEVKEIPPNTDIRRFAPYYLWPRIADAEIDEDELRISGGGIKMDCKT
jgi:hypothetical protein